MTPTELRALAETLEHECALRLIAGGKNHEEAQACEQAADYLLACADEKPVAKITRAGSGSIAMFAPDGGPFDMSKYIGAALFTHPAPATAQAEPIFCRDTGCSCNDELPDYAAEQAERPPTCLWSRADDDTDVWETTCGHAFTIIDGSPADNQMAFCCYCGRELESETGDSDADK